ncbi:hypothetical protein QJS04_geneDACA020463 [Acorus gramineus]|uniref:Uncharacterized protein n=1 Tax=Acorus gramineus TaxID=55184 RepID=A0AAV9ACS6_ACOGR|nr:hypothetical protein QJS04_geneDACA020463 [Acorus gramineus]
MIIKLASSKDLLKERPVKTVKSLFEINLNTRLGFPMIRIMNELMSQQYVEMYIAALDESRLVVTDKLRKKRLKTGGHNFCDDLVKSIA